MRQVFTTLLLIIALTGCVLPSIYPLYLDDDLVLDEELLGVWKNKEEKWKLEKKDSSFYRLTHSKSNGGDKATFTAGLLKIEGHTFLDISPLDIASKNDLFVQHLLPLHSFFKLEIINNQMTIKKLNPKWVKEALKQEQIEVSHIKPDGDRIILNATTEELQQFVLKHIEQFNDPLVLNKKK